MARRQIIVFEDDLDGAVIEESDIQLFKLYLAGEEFTFDLREETVAKVRAALTKLGLDLGDPAPPPVKTRLEAVKDQPVEVKAEPPEVSTTPPVTDITPQAEPELPPEPEPEPTPEPEPEPPAPPAVKRTELPPAGVTAKRIAKHRRPKLTVSADAPTSPVTADDEPLPEMPVFVSHPPMPDKITAPQHIIEPGVNVVSAEREPRPSSVVLSEVDPLEQARVDWDKFDDLEGAAVKLRDHVRNGLPAGVPFSYRPEVLSIEGMNFEFVENALRNPERVEIAGETFDKGYPIFRFHLGDVTTVLGMRTPREPRIIAAYHAGLLMNDVHRVNHSGGGGAAKLSGLPTTVKQSVDRLRRMGATIDYEQGMMASAVGVTFQDQDLGKVSVGIVKREQIQSDYQRMVRKITGIKDKARV